MISSGALVTHRRSSSVKGSPPDESPSDIVVASQILSARCYRLILITDQRIESRATNRQHDSDDRSSSGSMEPTVWEEPENFKRERKRLKLYKERHLPSRLWHRRCVCTFWRSHRADRHTVRQAKPGPFHSHAHVRSSGRTCFRCSVFLSAHFRLFDVEVR